MLVSKSVECVYRTVLDWLRDDDDVSRWVGAGYRLWVKVICSRSGHILDGSSGLAVDQPWLPCVCVQRAAAAQAEPLRRRPP